MDDSDFAKLFEDEPYCSQYSQLFKNYVDTFDYKLECLYSKKLEFLQNEQILDRQIDQHFEKIIQKVSNIKTKIKEDLRNSFQSFDDNIGLISLEADEIKSKIIDEKQSFEAITSKNKNINNNTNDYYDEDALCINSSFHEQRNEITELKNLFKRIENHMGQSKMIDQFFNEEKDFIGMDKDIIQLVQCIPEFDGSCFGHIKKSSFPIISNQNLAIIFDLMDHTSFRLEEPNFNNKFTYELMKQSSITFSCPNTLKSQSEKDYIYQRLETTLYNSKNEVVTVELKEKITLERRFIRIYYTPEITGVYKLVIKYNDNNIMDSPFNFIVVSEVKKGLNPTIQPASKFMSNGVDGIKSEPKNITDFPTTSSVSLVEPVALKNKNVCITAGRGRLMRSAALKNENTKNPYSHTPKVSMFTPFTSQKRKSPSKEPSTDLNNNNYNSSSQGLPDKNKYEIDDEEDKSMQQLSCKLKKVFVDESNNSMHNYTLPSSEDHSINSVMELSVNVPMNHSFSYEETPSQQNGQISQNNGQISRVSNHLKKYSGSKGGLVKFSDGIPNLRAEFVCKYANLSFPIGVRVCKQRNWVIVCDSSNSAVKIFDRDSTRLIHEINGTLDKSNPNQKWSFFRPSAVLINYENNSEIFVKDDKEILVFDLNNNFNMVRKFGLKILRRPYGLAFSQSGDLLLVDADLRNPLIYVFDKYTGKVISSKPYKPIKSQFSQSDQLRRRFAGDRTMPLGNDLDAFEKTKVRFLCSNNNFLYASDLGRSIVFKTDLEGEIQLAFGYHGRRKGQMTEPSGIHVDFDGEGILVGDSKNDRIQVYNGEGDYKCDLEITGDKLVRPSDIHLDVEGFLYVSCFTQQTVKKYRLISS